MHRQAFLRLAPDAQSGNPACSACSWT